MTLDHHRSRRGFTLIELLVVIGIIVLLVAILLPVVGQVRLRAYDTRTQGELSRIATACQQYFHDFNAYPGPIPNDQLLGGTGQITSRITGVSPGGQVTSSENLVLGLFGYLTPPTVPGNPATYTPLPANTPPSHDVLSLNPLHPATYHYMDFVPSELSPGLAQNLEYTGNMSLGDSNVPEFIDGMPEPMPIIYIRAATGAPAATSTGKVAMAGDPSATNVANNAQYNYLQLKYYGCSVRMASGPGTFMAFTPALLTTLYNGYNANPSTIASDIAPPFQNLDNGIATANMPAGYFANPSLANTPRGKDGFILISAGIDRTYGTSDDHIVTP